MAEVGVWERSRAVGLILGPLGGKFAQQSSRSFRTQSMMVFQGDLHDIETVQS